MATPDQHVVIVGAGHAGGSMASLLRQQGFDGRITLLGQETTAPYQRPPLSKAWLKADAGADELLLKPLAYYDGEGIDLQLGATVSAIDTGAQTVALGDGRQLGYDHLVLATGAGARRLQIPGHELDGILYLRDVADAQRLRAALAGARRIGIIGGGYIGLEVAASARALGVGAVIIEREARLLSRVASAAISRFFQRRHEQQGVDFVLGAGIAAIEGEAGRVTGVRLADGSLVDCDLLLVGIGAIPNDALAASAGLAVDGGVVVDADARTSVPNVYAIGDLALRPVPFCARRCRVESIPNALDGARRAACAIVGKDCPADEVPWFWSDQYDVKLQIAGIAGEVDRIVVRGAPDSGRFSVFHLRANVLQAAEVVNAPGDFLAAKKGIASGRVVDPERLADQDTPVMSLFR